MKKLIVVLLIMFSTVAKAQLWIGDDNTNEVITIKTDTMNVRESFKLLDRLCEGRMRWYDRRVIHRGEEYFKFGITFNRSRVYKIEGRKMVRYHEDDIN